MQLTWRNGLDDGETAEVMGLLEETEKADGVAPVGEHVILRLKAHRDVVHQIEPVQADVRSEHFIVRDSGGVLTGYAHLDTEHEAGSGQLVAELAVHPEHRGLGAGTRLVEALLERADLGAEPDADTGRLRIWSHGEHPGALRLSERYGFHRPRELWRMGRELAEPELPEAQPPEGQAFVEHTEDEALVDSGEFSGMQAAEAIGAITAQLEAVGLGGPAVTYRQRDWLVSRQRYWGAPIPIVYCDEHGAQPVPEEQLPVVLPEDVDFAPTGVSPLQSHADWLRAECPVCGREARRESDTMDTFVDSSWYFLRYCSPNDDTQPWDREALARWMPVDLYTGGSEHAVMHLLYFRFFVKALRDLGLLDFDEPALVLRNQGQILGADKQRMSKSRGNVQAPDELAARYGSDTVRAFLMFIGPWDQGGPWNPTGIDGIHRWLGRVWHAVHPELAQSGLAPSDGAQSDVEQSEGNDARRPMPAGQLPGLPAQTLAAEVPAGGEPAEVPARGEPHDDELLGTTEELNRALRRATHRAIASVTEDYDAFRFNTGIARLMELTTALGRARDSGLAGGDAYSEAADTLLLLMAPVTPHIAEELWERRGHAYSIHAQPWPTSDPELAATETIELPVQVDGKLRDRLVVTRDTPAEEIEQLVLASEHVQRYLGGRPPARVIQVPGKLVNVVTPR